MSAYVSEAKEMANWLLKREHRGPGDTIEAAAYRLQTKYGLPVALLMRLRHREVKDMLISSFVAISSAYQAATDRMGKAYEHERAMAANPRVVRLADFVAGAGSQDQTE